MPILTVDVHESKARLDELADAVMQGQDVVITHRGEPVAVSGLRCEDDAEPPVWLRGVILDLLEAAIERFCDPPWPRPWCMN